MRLFLRGKQGERAGTDGEIGPARGTIEIGSRNLNRVGGIFL